MLIAKWATIRGKHWVKLYRHSDGGYSYQGNDCGGCLGVLANDSTAIQVMENKLHYMVPDNAKIGMVRMADSTVRTLDHAEDCQQCTRAIEQGIGNLCETGRVA